MRTILIALFFAGCGNTPEPAVHADAAATADAAVDAATDAAATDAAATDAARR